MGTKNHRFGIHTNGVESTTRVVFSDEQLERHRQNFTEYDTPLVATDDLFPAIGGIIERGVSNHRELKDVARYLGGTLHIGEI